MSAKGARRREALVDAAARLLAEHGPDGVTARATAAEAGVPLAAVTYYFADVDELARAAAAQELTAHVEHARRLVAGVRRGASDRVVADRLVRAVLGPVASTGGGAVAALYARSLAAARRPGWQPQLAAWDDDLLLAVTDLLAAAGRPTGGARWVLACVDGLAVSAVVRGVPHPVADLTRSMTAALPRLVA